MIMPGDGLESSAEWPRTENEDGKKQNTTATVNKMLRYLRAAFKKSARQG